MTPQPRIKTGRAVVALLLAGACVALGCLGGHRTGHTYDAVGLALERPAGLQVNEANSRLNDRP